VSSPPCDRISSCEWAGRGRAAKGIWWSAPSATTTSVRAPSASATGPSTLRDSARIPGTCTPCHDTPNSGNHSIPAPLRIGTAEVDPVGGLDVSALPVYTLRNLATGETVRVTDPGRALITGLWKDIARFTGPILRGLPSRASYFHNGAARTLQDVVNFYDARFGMQLTRQEKADLEAFLAAL
jgi:cytochrome c peroxidase